MKTSRLALVLAAAAAAVSAVLLGGGSLASADIIAQYNFEEFTTTEGSYPANNGPYLNSA